ncbi:hypothetical protein ACFQ5M_11505 [Agrilactobacillus yilanensis]|uniref:PepSY domain-containing protein n=1 Tax=Agrilactobacillus yilanensis TaxID=2485997 RepID=A0ABW4JCN8_9LACO|nr:hypothetical protein [Agrilactobacillus yilanensis]
MTKSKYYGYGFLAGTLLGSSLVYSYQARKQQKRAQILDHVKALFLREGPIEGAWIEEDIEPYSDQTHLTKAYFGGVTRMEDDVLRQYQFAADATTGELLDVYKI